MDRCWTKAELQVPAIGRRLRNEDARGELEVITAERAEFDVVNLALVGRELAQQRFGAEMKTFARFLLVGTMLLARCAWATEPSPVAFAKSVVSERGSQTFATVSYPDKSLIVQFRLEPYSAGKATAVRAFGEITKKIAQGAFSKFPKIKSVQLIGNLALRDKRGNDTVDRAVMVKFSKVKAATINWETVDPANVVEIADKHWILPELGADKK